MKKAEKGQALIIFSFLIIAVLLFAALALDGGSLFVQRRDAQTAADTAAFAGAAAITSGSSADQAKSIAALRAASNGFNNDQVTNWVTVNYPPAIGPFMGKMDHLQVIIRAKIQTSFIQLVFPDSTESTTESVVRFSAASPIGGSNALIGLSNTDCDTVLVNDNMNVTVHGGSIYSNSNANSQNCYSMEKMGTFGVLNVINGGINVVGAFNNTGQSSNVNPTPVTGVSPFTTLSIPPPDCTCSENLSGAACTNNDVNVNSHTTIAPGIYHNVTLTSYNGNLTINPGLYCITGDFTASMGSITGSNVIIVMEGGTLNLTGNASISLSAVEPPLSSIKALYWGTDGSQHNYVGLLVYADPTKYTGISDNKTIAIGGTNGSIFTGTVYAPKTTCALSGTSGTITYNSQIYCYTDSVSGTAEININFSASQNWLFPPMLDLEY
jgi:hypothetical protein